MNDNIKTWPQIADIILTEIHNRPGGDDLVSLEFHGADSKVPVPPFTIELKNGCDTSYREMAQSVADIINRLSCEHYVRTFTVH
ncbi:hypothetical protein [Methylobacterium oryzisoli]|uniref:hypothetical protein n=1 Tax=Methylobacterium oryzisoli TaxID=3385502 RepID=UPI003891E865